MVSCPNANLLEHCRLLQIMLIPPYALSMRNLLILIATLLAFTTSGYAESKPTTSIEDLAWMTGTWAGHFDTSSLEETWNKPFAGSMLAIVRSSSHANGMQSATTDWLETISIVEEDGGLMLRLQQFTPEMRPRFEAQPLKMTALSERSVTFEAIGAGGLRSITYSRPSEDEFHINVLLTEGNTFVAKLKRAQP